MMSRGVVPVGAAIVGVGVLVFAVWTLQGEGTGVTSVPTMTTVLTPVPEESVNYKEVSQQKEKLSDHIDSRTDFDTFTFGGTAGERLEIHNATSLSPPANTALAEIPTGRIHFAHLTDKIQQLVEFTAIRHKIPPDEIVARNFDALDAQDILAEWNRYMENSWQASRIATEEFELITAEYEARGAFRSFESEEAFEKAMDEEIDGLFNLDRVGYDQNGPFWQLARIKLEDHPVLNA